MEDWKEWELEIQLEIRLPRYCVLIHLRLLTAETVGDWASPSLSLVCVCPPPAHTSGIEAVCTTNQCGGGSLQDEMAWKVWEDEGVC